MVVANGAKKKDVSKPAHQTMPHKKLKGGHMAIIENWYHQIPAFTDVFTEESFYMFAVCFVLATIAVVLVLSRFITLKPVD